VLASQRIADAGAAETADHRARPMAERAADQGAADGAEHRAFDPGVVVGANAVGVCGLGRCLNGESRRGQQGGHDASQDQSVSHFLILIVADAASHRHVHILCSELNRT